MTNLSIVPFEFETKAIRTISDEHGDPWFVLRDLLEAMQSKTKTTDAVESVDQGLGKGFVNGVPLETEGGTQQVTIVAEAAATFLLARSNTETGRRLNRFIHVEVLPTLRKTGRYAIPVEASISPAQQRQLQNAIAARFPEGKHRPYAWSRFNNHFALGSYKQLPGSKTDEALAYIAQMPNPAEQTEGGIPRVPGPVGGTGGEQAARDALCFSRFLAYFDHEGRINLREVDRDAYIVTERQIETLVREPGEIKQALLPGIIEAAARRLKKA